jgi:hypothetical protein
MLRAKTGTIGLETDRTGNTRIMIMAPNAK